jgi:uncharacterized protein YjbI with pentapeptide repeats
MTIGTQVGAADPTDLKKLKDIGICIWCNLVSADLSDANLDGTNLTGAAMKGITLCNTIMPDGSVLYSGC